MILAGQVIAAQGFTTVILNVHCFWLPELSVAVQVTVVIPNGKQVPDGGMQTTVGAGVQLSVADGVE